jgi:alcohol dehydrogenase class IV
LLVLLCLSASAVSAEEAADFPTEDIIEACEGPWDKDASSNAMFKTGFCVGVIHSLFYRSSEKYCIPHNVSTLQAINVVISYVIDNNFTLRYPFLLVAEKAFEKTWPCYRIVR